MLVGDGGNAPLVVFRPCLETTVLPRKLSGLTGTSPVQIDWWRQWELHPPQTDCETVSPLRHMCPRNTGTACWCHPNHAEFWRLDCASWRTPCVMEIGALGGSRTHTSAMATRCSAAKPRAPWKIVGQEHNAATCGTQLPALCSCPSHNKERTPSPRHDAGVATGFLGGTFRCFGHTSHEALIVVILRAWDLFHYGRDQRLTSVSIA